MKLLSTKTRSLLPHHTSDADLFTEVYSNYRLTFYPTCLFLCGFRPAVNSTILFYFLFFWKGAHCLTCASVLHHCFNSSLWSPHGGQAKDGCEMLDLQPSASWTLHHPLPNDPTPRLQPAQHSPQQLCQFASPSLLQNPQSSILGRPVAPHKLPRIYKYEQCAIKSAMLYTFALIFVLQINK